MAHSIRKLASQTVVYGTTNIIGRLLNYLLVPLHTYIFSDAAQYGVVGELYAWSSLFIVILTYGMETAFFRYSQDEEITDKVYTTIITSFFITSSLFIVLCSCFSRTIAGWLHYSNHPEYIVWFAIIIGVDALTSIFFARLRYLNKAFKFAAIKIVNIVVNVLLNFFFLLLCPTLLKHYPISHFVRFIYKPEIGIGYIFIANLVASVVTLLLLLPSLWKQRLRFDGKLWKKMFRYAFPLLIFGLAGIVNETMDRIFIKYYSPADEPQASVGIYSACYKITIFMTICIQAFKYAAEPFFFDKAKDRDAKETYAKVMTIFVMVCSIIYVGVLLYIDVVKFLVGATYRVGLSIVPILLMANLFLGIFYNLSIWYKLQDKTIYGAGIALLGAGITVGLNILLIPHFDYMGAAWTTFLCYLTMMVVSYLLGQKYYHVNYDLKRIVLYLLSAVAIYGISLLFHFKHLWLRLTINTLLLIGYLAMMFLINRRAILAFIHARKKK